MSNHHQPVGSRFWQADDDVRSVHRRIRIHIARHHASRLLGLIDEDLGAHYTVDAIMEIGLAAAEERIRRHNCPSSGEGGEHEGQTAVSDGSQGS